MQQRPPSPQVPYAPPGAYAPWQGQPQQPGPGYPPPQAPGFGPPVPPAPSGPSTAVIVVIVVVVILAVIIVIPAMLYLAVTSEGPGGPPSVRPTVTLASGAWSGGGTAIIITSVSSTTISISALAYQVVAGNGTIYFSGESGTTSDVNGVATTVTYNDAPGGGTGTVGPDDNIVIQVSPAAGLNQIHGTTLRILMGSDVLGHTMLP